MFFLRLRNQSVPIKAVDIDLILDKTDKEQQLQQERRCQSDRVLSLRNQSVPIKAVDINLVLDKTHKDSNHNKSDAFRVTCEVCVKSSSELVGPAWFMVLFFSPNQKILIPRHGLMV